MKYLRNGLMAVVGLLALCTVALAPAAAATCNGAPWTADAFFSGGCQKASVLNAGDNRELAVSPKATVKGITEEELAKYLEQAGANPQEPTKTEPGLFGVTGASDRSSASSSGSGGVNFGTLK